MIGIGITAEEGDAPANSGKWDETLSDASTVCLVGSAMGDVDEAVEALVSAVEGEILIPEAIRGTLMSVNGRGEIIDPKMVDRIHAIGLTDIAVRAAGATLEFLIRVGGDEGNKQAANLAREILRTRGQKGQLAADTLEAGVPAEDVIDVVL